MADLFHPTLCRSAQGSESLTLNQRPLSDSAFTLNESVTHAGNFLLRERFSANCALIFLKGIPLQDLYFRENFIRSLNIYAVLLKMTL
jgi:hypothetical protein